MFVWRNAIILGAIFMVVGIGYALVQGSGNTLDMAGATLLTLLGVAMAFIFVVLLRGSREM